MSTSSKMSNPKMTAHERYKQHIETCDNQFAYHARERRAFYQGWNGALEAAIFLLEQEGHDIGPQDPVGDIIFHLKELRDDDV